MVGGFAGGPAFPSRKLLWLYFEEEESHELDRYTGKPARTSGCARR
jgi:hypothetical protein